MCVCVLQDGVVIYLCMTDLCSICTTYTRAHVPGLKQKKLES